MQVQQKWSRGLKASILNIGWLSLDRMIRMGGALIVGTLVARYLEPSAFGQLNLATAIFMLFNTVSNLGLDYLVVRDTVLDQESVPEVLGTAFLLKAGASVLTTSFALLFTWATHPHQALLVWMTAVLSIAAISQALDVIDFFFQARTLSRYTVIPKLLTFVLVNLLRLAAVFRHASVLIFAELAAAEILFGELALLVSYRFYAHGLSRWRFNMARGWKLLQESWPLVLASLLVMIYMRTDQILLGYMLNDQAVGYYSAAVRLSEIWYAVPALICNSVMPQMLRLLTENKVLYYRRVQMLYNALVLLSVLLAVITLPASRFAVTLLFGKAYLPAAHVLNIHIWTGVFVFIGVLGGQQMVHEKLTVVELQRAGLGAGMNLVLNLLLIPRYGIVGSAVSTLAAQATASYLADVFDPRSRHIFWMKTRALSGIWLLRRDWRTQFN